jgi:hypothetical protein
MGPSLRHSRQYSASYGDASTPEHGSDHDANKPTLRYSQVIVVVADEPNDLKESSASSEPLEPPWKSSKGDKAIIAVLSTLSLMAALDSTVLVPALTVLTLSTLYRPTAHLSDPFS